MPPKHPTPPEPQRRLPILLRRAWYGLNQAFRRRISHTRCTPDQYTVLRNLHELHPTGLSQAQLTRAMSSDANTIASLVRRMENQKLLVRSTDPNDRRARRLQLTEKGQTKFEELRRIALQLQEDMLQHLPAKNRDAFLQQLETLALACQKASEITSPKDNSTE